MLSVVDMRLEPAWPVLCCADVSATLQAIGFPKFGGAGSLQDH